MGSYVSARREVMSALRKEGRLVVERTANAVRTDAQQMVPQPGQDRGYATGALRAAIHVVTPDESGYGPAIDAAMEAPDTRILQRDQIEPPENVSPEKNKNKALVVAPLSYAKLIEQGFQHVRAGRRVIGVHYMLSALNRQSDAFEESCRHLIDLLGSISPTTAAMREAERQWRFEGAQQRAARSQVRTERALQFDVFRGRVQADFLAPEKGEEMVEAWERIGRTFEEMKGVE